MGRNIQKLSAIKVKRIANPGMCGDGGGLWLQVSPARSKSWVFRYMRNGRAREMGLGPLSSLTLAEARLKAAECRKQLLEGLDPIGHREATRTAEKLEAAKTLSFAQCATAYIDSHKTGWRNTKHVAQWRSTLKTYTYFRLSNDWGG